MVKVLKGRKGKRGLATSATWWLTTRIRCSSQVGIVVLILLTTISQNSCVFSPQSHDELESAIDACYQDTETFATFTCCYGVSRRHLQKDDMDGKKTKDEPPFRVTGCKSGTFPITVEKRKYNKMATLVHNVEGDVPLLLKELKIALGAGGVYHEDTKILEIQGDNVKRVSKFLVKRGCLKGVSKKQKDAVEDKKKKTTAKTTKQLKKPTIDTSEQLSKKEINLLNPTMLKVYLESHGMSTQGNKKELQARLVEVMAQLNTPVSTPESLG